MMTLTSRSRTGGFTLVELVLVIIIIGVLGAIALPRFAQANARQQLSAAANRVASDLEQAQLHARTTSNTVTMTFDLSQDSYTLTPAEGDATTIHLDRSPYRVALSDADFGGAASIVFNGFGFPASAGEVTVQSNAGSAVIQLENSGRVTR